VIAEPLKLGRFEFHLVRILCTLVGVLPFEQTSAALNGRRPAPAELSATCLRLARETLAKGLILDLVRRGGWRRDEAIRDGTIRTGAVWERWPLEERALEFGDGPLSFAVWLTKEKADDSRVPWDAEPNDLSAADELFFWKAYESLRDGEPLLAAALRAKSAFRKNALCRLMFAFDFADEGDAFPLDFARWMVGKRSMILECLRPALAMHWVEQEEAKGLTRDWKALRTAGRVQERTIEGYLSACEAANRRDLAVSILDAASGLLKRPGLDAAYWIGALAAEAAPNRLSERLETHRAALGFLRQFGNLQRWDRQARGIGYFDDDYRASQYWKAAWERADGDRLHAAAQQLLAQIEPLRATDPRAGTPAG